MISVKKVILFTSLLLVSVAIYFWCRPPIYKRQFVFKDPAKAVQDSMKLLQTICESVDKEGFFNCYVRSWDSTLVFKGQVLGKINHVSASNPAFKNMERRDVIRLLSVIKFLNRNLVSGVVHDTSIGYWLYPYGSNLDYENIKFIRNIYIWEQPKEISSPSFKYHFTVIDRKENMILVAHNDFGNPLWDPK